MNTNHPWQSLYPAAVRTDLPDLAHSPSLTTAWAERVARDPEATALLYFDGRLTVSEVDQLSDALAAALQERGVTRGDRVAIRLQNVPAYPITMLALWKIGAAALLVNPMYRRQELRHLLTDSEAVGMLVDETDVEEAVEAARESRVRWIVGVSGHDFQTRDDPRVFDTHRESTAAPDGAWTEWVERFRGRRPDSVEPEADDLALLAYTSGTTGPPRGAMNSHRNVLTAVASYGDWVDLGTDDVVFAMAPFFHITGAVINATMALLHDTSLVMTHRFQPAVALDAFVEHSVTFTVGSITAFNAVAAQPHVDRRHFATVRYLYSGGAPIPPTTP